jgi:predicted Zn finger-like uncharacterized protein
MQIACPNCSTTYQIAATAVGASGRSVRCVRCQSIWFVPSPGVIPAISEHAVADAEAPADDNTQAPPQEMASAVADDHMAGAAEQPSGPGDGTAAPPVSSADETAAAQDTPDHAAVASDEHVALSDISIPVTDAPPLAPEPGDGMSGAALEHDAEDIERVAERRRIRAAARRRQTRMRVPLPVVIILMLFVCGALIGLRKDIVRHVPQMASFYSSIGLPVNLRGLVFSDVKISNETHDGVPVLVVEGVIASTVNVPVDLPRIRFALRNAASAEVYSWTAQPSQPVLEPGETLPFRSRLASPPPDGQDLQVRFFTRRDAAGGGR